jgi:arsenite-transporting ATPase
LPFGLVGIAALRQLFARDPAPRRAERGRRSTAGTRRARDAPSLARSPSARGPGRGVIMTMGKGGVGKTSVAVNVAVELARRGHEVHLTTTDPAAHVEEPSAARSTGSA